MLNARELFLQVMGKAMKCFMNAYKVTNIHLRAYGCATNIPSRTSFRSLGVLQSAWMIENIITEAALKFGLDHNQVLPTTDWDMNYSNAYALILFISLRQYIRVSSFGHHQSFSQCSQFRFSCLLPFGQKLPRRMTISSCSIKPVIWVILNYQYNILAHDI